jgi:hypothetical protein
MPTKAESSSCEMIPTDGPETTAFRPLSQEELELANGGTARGNDPPIIDDARKARGSSHGLPPPIIDD